MADDLPAKVKSIKGKKAAVEKKGVPAGAQGGASATTGPEKSTSGVKAVYAKQNTPPPAGGTGG